jgi:xylulokinase
MFLGVDIGTTGVKASAVSPDGRICAESYAKFHMLGLSEDKRELDPAEIWKGVQRTVAEAAAGFAGQIELITISSLGEAIVPVDAKGEPLMNSIVGSDRRGAAQLKWMAKEVPPDEITDITGLNLSSIYSLNKILYLKQNAAEVYARTKKIFCVADYIVFRLTGEEYMDYSLASRTMAFDYRAYDWSRRILDAAGVPRELLPKAVPTGTVAGTLLPSVAVELGLPLGTRVAIGAHDHIFNAIGAGAVENGTCSNAVGTTEGLTAYLGSQRLPVRTIADGNISCEPFALPGTFNTVAWHNTAGAMLNWFAGVFFEGAKDKDSILAILRKMDASCSRKPGRLMVLPHFSGSTTEHMDDQSKGAILGLSLSTTKEEIYKALMEGATYELKLIFHALSKAGIAMERIVVSGGGSRSRLWLETKADVLGQPVTTAASPETGALGSAVLAAVTCGYYRSLPEAAKAMVRFGETVEPDMQNHEIYRERFETYRGLYGSLKEVNHRLCD